MRPKNPLVLERRESQKKLKINALSTSIGDQAVAAIAGWLVKRTEIPQIARCCPPKASKIAKAKVKSQSPPWASVTSKTVIKIPAPSVTLQVLPADTILKQVGWAPLPLPIQQTPSAKVPLPLLQQAPVGRGRRGVRPSKNWAGSGQRGPGRARATIRRRRRGERAPRATCTAAESKA